jgi:hypothetical protein
VNRLFGLIVLGLAGAVGFGSISGCPPKKATDTAGKTPVNTGSSGGKLTLTVPAEVKLETDKDKGTFEVKVKREAPLEGEATITFSGAPDGVIINADPIAKDKDTTTATITLDKAKAKAGTYDITVTGKVKDEEAKAKMKLILTTPKGDGGGAQTAKPFTLTVKPAEVDADIPGKSTFEVSVTREGHTGPVTLKYKGIPTGVTFQGDMIPADKDSLKVDVIVEKTASKGTSEVTVDAHIGDSKAEAPLKLKLK